MKTTTMTIAPRENMGKSGNESRRETSLASRSLSWKAGRELKVECKGIMPRIFFAANTSVSVASRAKETSEKEREGEFGRHPRQGIRDT